MDQVDTDTIVGSWMVQLSGAWPGPHLIAFLPGGVALTTLPDSTSSRLGSIGLGTWEQRPLPTGKIDPTDMAASSLVYQGTFATLVSVPSSQTSATLTLTWVITLDADHLTGSGQATSDKHPTQLQQTHLTGTRIRTDLDTLTHVTNR